MEKVLVHYVLSLKIKKKPLPIFTAASIILFHYRIKLKFFIASQTINSIQSTYWSFEHFSKGGKNLRVQIQIFANQGLAETSIPIRYFHLFLVVFLVV